MGVWLRKIAVQHTMAIVHSARAACKWTLCRERSLGRLGAYQEAQEERTHPIHRVWAAASDAENSNLPMIILIVDRINHDPRDRQIYLPWRYTTRHLAVSLHPAEDLRNSQEARGVFRPRSGRIGFRREQPLSHAGVARVAREGG